MKHFTLFLRKGFTSALTLAVAMIVLGGNIAKADELVVTSTTSKTYTENTPIAGNLLGTTLIKSEFIIPSSKLTALQGKEITNMSFTLNAATSGWGDAEFTVFLKEVSDTEYPSPVVLKGTDGATIVYEGSLDATKTSIDISFTTPFSYTSNNLLVGVYCTKLGTAASVYFKLIRENTSDYTYYAGYTNNASGSLTRTNWYPETKFTYQAANLTTPHLTINTDNISFGSLRASDTQTVTVTNTGVGTMDVTIANDNTTDFTVSATSLTGIGAGESQTFDVTFNYNAESLGDKSANITVTPSYDASDAKVIAVSATAANAAVWEDFSDGIPSTWYNENNSWLNYVTGLSGWASPGYNSTHVLRTPRLYAEAGSALGFDVKIVGKYSSNKVTASYSTDRVTWSTPVDYTADGTYAIEAPATGYYWVQFTASQAGIDNITGWTVAASIHDTRLGAATIPTVGTAYGTYTASVVVKELGGSNETVTAELYFGEDKVAEQTNIAVNGNRDVTVSLSYLPTETFEGKVYIKVSGENIGTLESDKVDVVVSETPYVFDENSDVNPVISSSSVVKVKYTARQGWNTIVMPFSLSSSPAYMNSIFGEGWKAYYIDGSNEGTINFKSVTSYMATTTPFIVYAPNAESHPDGVYLQNVSAGSYNWGHANINQTKGDVTFKGTFAPIAAPGMEGKYGVTSDGRIAKGSSNASIKAYHAYFEVSAGSGIKGFVIDGEDATDIGLVQMVEGSDKPVYNMSGQKVQKAQRGIYIINGKKVVIK